MVACNLLLPRARGLGWRGEQRNAGAAVYDERRHAGRIRRFHHGLSDEYGVQTAMRAVLQRVSRAQVSVEGKVVGSIREGLLVLLAVGGEDEEADAAYLAEKTAGLRIFQDEAGKMNRSVEDVGGQVLVVSQFTLFGDCRRGRRPGFSQAAPPELADRLYQRYVSLLRARGLTVETGVFQAMMKVESVNEGPVTILLDSKKLF